MARSPEDIVEPQASAAWVRRGERIICQTVDQFAALWPGARFASDADDFYANALRLQFGQFRLETSVNSAYSCVRDASDIAAFPRPGVAVEIVLEGTLHRTQRGVSYVQRAGDAAVTVLDEPFEFHWSAPGRSVRTVSPLGLLPPRLRDPEVLPSGLLDSTPLVASYVGFIGGLVDVAQPDTVEQQLLEQSVIVLHQAVISEAAQAQAQAVTPDPLEQRIDAYIDAHLANRRLTPTSIAADLGVSLRSVHGAFNTADRTVAGEIRRRRIMAAIDLFARADPSYTMARVAQEVGFSGPDQLRRSFVTVTGRSTREFREDML